MKAKKLLAGALAGTMVLGCASVPVLATNNGEKVTGFAKTQKVAPVSTTATKMTHGGKAFDKLTSFWWDPDTFSDGLEVTEQRLTIDFTYTAKYAKKPDSWGSDTKITDQLGYIIAYYSSSGMCYGGNPGEKADHSDADKSWAEGVKKNMTEYANIRPDGWAYNFKEDGSRKDGSSSWDSSGGLVSSGLYWGVTVDHTNTEAEGFVWEADPDNDIDWPDGMVEAASKGAKCQVTAVKSGKNVIITYDFAGFKTQTTIPLKTSTMYICFNTGSADKGSDGTYSNMTYSYQSAQAAQQEKKAKEDVVVKASATSYTYDGKKHVPTFTVKSKSTGKDIKSNFKIEYSNAKSKYAGTYFIWLTGKSGDYKSYPKTQVVKYKIKQQNQDVKIKKIAGKTKYVNKKKTGGTYTLNSKKKKKVTFTIVATGFGKELKKGKEAVALSSSKPKVISAKVTKLKNGTATIKVTVAKNAKKGTYKLRINAKIEDSGTYHIKSSQRTVKIKIKKVK